jgi:hypothetical protein
MRLSCYGVMQGLMRTIHPFSYCFLIFLARKIRNANIEVLNKLGIDGMTIARRYHLTQSAIVHAARRGEKIAKEMNCQLLK